MSCIIQCCQVFERMKIMDNKRFDDLIASAMEAVAHKQGTRKLRTHAGTINEIKAIRLSLQISQEEFAYTYGVPLRSLQNWEQANGRTPPTAVMSYFKAIKNAPEVVRKAIAE